MSTHEERVEMHAKFLTLLANIGSTEERAKRMNVVWECTACGHLDVSPEKCPGMYAYQVAMFVREN